MSGMTRCADSPSPYQPEGAERFERPDVHAGDRPSGASFASRSAALGRSGAAGTAHPLATLSAIETLKRGGSAVDAAVAANACLGFLEPTGCGLGGDCFAMVWDPGAAKLVGLAGAGRSPRTLSLETVRARAKHGLIPAYGAIAVSTPGALDAWWTLHQRYGTLKWPELFEPAIELCESGAAVPQIIGVHIERNLSVFLDPSSGVEETANALSTYAPGGRAPREGDVMRNPDLARTYRTIAQGGRDAFYEGPIARVIDAYFKRIGGWLSYEDLRGQRAEWTDPLVTDYRGVQVYALAANTQGLATLQMLNILENFDLRAMGFQSAGAIHIQAEAKRLAYEDRARYYADPHFAEIPVEWLNSKAYAASARSSSAPTACSRPFIRAGPRATATRPISSVADSSGMMVSMIQSNFRGMGSGLVADGLGFMFQDRGELFSLVDGHPNIYQPGKRPFHTIIPGFAAKGGRPWMSFGVMGGDMQPQGQTQIIVNRVDFGLDVQAAGDSPRWHHEGSSAKHGRGPAGARPSRVASLGDRRARGLATRARGHRLDASAIPMEASGATSASSSARAAAQRVYAAASEMRADGVALAY